MLPTPTTPLSRGEFVVLIAFMVSIVAMSTDIMLPALAVIGQDLGIADPNDAQMIVTALFLGFGVGLLFAGPLSDSYGRKPVIYVGYCIFLLGCVMSALTETWELMI
ncbi:MAG: DHA1 family bicyclomycin/chloramphenicol resistance-like MFS transporter, partial [Polaromonas sp.]